MLRSSVRIAYDTIASCQHSRLYFGLYSGEKVSELTMASNYDRHTSQSRGWNQAQIGIQIKSLSYSDFCLVQVSGEPKTRPPRLPSINVPPQPELRNFVQTL